MKAKITVLCENSVFGVASWGATAEHGWAVFLETDQGNFLLDTGQGMTIINNARVFRKDLRNLQGIILSHHHSDHTGGLLAVLQASGPVKVYAHPDIFKDSYSIQIEGKEFDVGMPFKRSILESYGAQFVFVQQYQEIAPGLFLTGEIPRCTTFEKGDPKLVVKGAKGYEQDMIQDDLTVVMETAQGLVVILGCSHAGLVNILNYVREKTGKSGIYAIIGGTHLAFTSQEQLDETTRMLKACAVQKIGVSHCTGMLPALRMLQEFGEKFFFCPVGTVLEV